MELVDTHLKINRGNTLRFDYSIEAGEDTLYVFKEDDIVTFSIYNAFGLNEDPLLTKSFKPEPDTTELKIVVSKEEMKIGPMENMEIDYWYEITLNEETVSGFDGNGPKIITIYPEGKAPENE